MEFDFWDDNIKTPIIEIREFIILPFKLCTLKQNNF